MNACQQPVDWPKGRTVCYLPPDDPIHFPAAECARLSDLAECPKPEAHHEFVPEKDERKVVEAA